MQNINCMMLLFDVNPCLLNSIIHQSFGNFEFLGIHHNPVTRSANVCWDGACTALFDLSIRKRVLDYLNPSGFLDVISIIALIPTTGIGILLVASSIAFFIPDDNSIF